MKRFFLLVAAFLFITPGFFSSTFAATQEEEMPEQSVLLQDPSAAPTGEAEEEVVPEEAPVAPEKEKSEEESPEGAKWLPLGDTGMAALTASSTPSLDGLTPKSIDPSASLKGLQGKYETDLFTGSATFSYPLWVPAGRNGMTPPLELRYSSTNLNPTSSTGMGWSLPLGAIYRSTTKGLNKLYTENTFAVDLFGSYSDLISIDSANGKYAERIETTFSDYTFQGNTWTMKDNAGTVYTFGSSAATRQADPNDSSRVYKWLLEKVQDTNGNFMTFTYAAQAGQLYPDKIRYTGHGTEQGIYEIRFIREARTYIPSSYVTGFKVEGASRLKKIEVHLLEPTDRLVRTYEFAYETEESIQLFLSSITTKGGSLAFPPIEFSYFKNGDQLTGLQVGLLKKIEYPTGGTQSITYKPSTAYRTGTQLSNASLPFIIQTVHTSTTQAGTSDPAYTTTYEYSGGHYYFDSLDAFTREYAGFHEVTITDPASNVGKLFFHQSEFSKDNSTSSGQGEFQDHISKKGRIYRQEAYDDAAHLFQVTIRKWDKTTLSDDAPDFSRAFPFLARETTALYDGNASAKTIAVTYAYDSHGNITEETDYGEVTLSGQDGGFTDTLSDKIITTSEYAENTSAHIYSLPKRQVRKDGSNVTIAETKTYYDNSALGQVTNGNPTKNETIVEAPSTYLITTAAYNSYGLPTSLTNARNKTTTIAYESKNLYPSTITNPKNQVTSYSYDLGFGVATEMTDPNGAKTITIFDDLGRMTETKVSNPASPTQQVTAVTYAYDMANTPNSMTRTNFLTPGGTDQIVKTYFDGFARVVQVRKEAEGTYHVSSLSYDERGNIAKEFLPVASSGLSFTTTSASAPGTALTYDALNRVISVVTPVGTSTTSYDNWMEVVTDPNGNRKDYKYDARKNLVEVKEYLDSTAYSTAYTYNLLNQLTRITDAKGNLKNMTYDLLGRKLAEEDLHVSGDTTFGTWSYDYDENGNLVSKTDPKSQTVNYAYDDLDRVLTEDYAGATGTEVTYTYDQGTYGVGRLSSVSNPSIQKSFSYDLLGRITSDQRVLSGNTYTTGFTYDLAGNLLSVTYPDSMAVTYQYNSAGLLESVQKNSSDVVTNLDYAPNGLLEQIDFANGVSTVNTYDLSELYRLTHKETTKGTTKLQDISYTFDPVGNITEIMDASDTNAAKTAEYTYDDLHRLVSATVTGTANSQDYTHTYTYDVIGNILTRSDAPGSYAYAGGESSTASGTVASPHAVTGVGSVTYGYDANGNLTSDGAWTHSWDYANRLLSSDNGTTTVEYEYDEAGQRVKKHSLREEIIEEQPVTTEKTTLYVNQYHDIEDGTPKNFIYAGDMKVATEESEDLIFHHEDHLTGGNVDTDNTGAVVELLDYFPYGNIRFDEKAGAYENDYKYTGKELDQDTDLYYYEARYYDASIGRFTSLDPWAGDLRDPQSLNKYSYVRNNPLKYVDKTGGFFDTVWDIGNLIVDVKTAVEGIGGVIGGGVAYVQGWATGNEYLKDAAKEGINESMEKVANGGIDLAVDSVATLVPFVPAGVSKIDNAVDTGKSLIKRIWTKTKDYSSFQNAFKHWKDHGNDFPDIENAVQYTKRAREFLQNPPEGALSKIRKNGDTIIYEPKTNTFGVKDKDGTPKTFFKPEDGKSYFDKQQ